VWTAVAARDQLLDARPAGRNCGCPLLPFAEIVSPVFHGDLSSAEFFYPTASTFLQSRPDLFFGHSHSRPDLFGALEQEFAHRVRGLFVVSHGDRVEVTAGDGRWVEVTVTVFAPH